MAKKISFMLNGEAVTVVSSQKRMLLWVLRSDLQHTGTKYGCGEGYCGFCTVLVNDEAVLACQVPVETVEGKKVTTIEGLAEKGKLHPVQEAFLRHNALQCGYCTPGMIMRTLSLLKKNPSPSEAEIRDTLEGNLCRCGTYRRIILAVQTAAQTMKGTRP